MTVLSRLIVGDFASTLKREAVERFRSCRNIHFVDDDDVVFIVDGLGGEATRERASAPLNGFCILQYS